MSIQELIQKNQHRWDNMHVLAGRLPALHSIAIRLCAEAAWTRYVKISAATQVPPWVIAVIHEREASQSFTNQLGQGDPLSRVSTHDPIGRGPFFNHTSDPPGEDAFYRGAVDALVDCAPHASKWVDWTGGGTCTLLEEYNGLGYAAMGVPSAYVWSGSDQYQSGKYIADHVYRSGVVDVQEGCAPLLHLMQLLRPEIKF